MFCGVAVRLEQLLEPFQGGARLPTTADVIFSQRLVYFLFLRELCFEYWKKQKHLVFQWQKSGKNGRAIENFKGIMVFLFCYTCPIFNG